MNALKAGLRTRLTASTALMALLSGTASVRYALAGTATLPVVTYSLATDTEQNVTPRPEREYLMDIKAIGTDGTIAGNIAAQIDTAMQTPVTVTGWNNIIQRRERGIDYQETDNGKTYFHIGATYRLRLQG